MKKTNSIRNFRMYCNSYECPEYIKRYLKKTVKKAK